MMQRSFHFKGHRIRTLIDDDDAWFFEVDLDFAGDLSDVDSDQRRQVAAEGAEGQGVPCISAFGLGVRASMTET